MQTSTKNKIVVAGIAVVLLLLLFLFRNTWRDIVITQLGGYTDKETEIRVDTLPSIIDTIYVPKIERELVPIITDPIVKYKDTIIYKDKPTIVIDSVYEYVLNIEDSIIKGNINTKINKGTAEIVDQKLVYTAKVPMVIREVVPINTTIEHTIAKDNRNKFGIGANVSNLESIGVIGAYQTKNNLQFQVNYSILVGNKKVTIDNNTYNHLIQVGIIKFF